MATTQRRFPALPHLLTVLMLAALPACGDDTTIISTFSYTNISASTVSNGADDDGEDSGDETATGGDTGAVSVTEGASDEDSTGEIDPSTGEADTVGMSETTVPTTGTTGDDGMASQPFPPTGCAHFVEFFGRAAESERYATINAMTCPRAANIEVTFLVFGATGPFTAPLGQPAGCEMYGGEESLAQELGGQVVAIPGVDDPTNFQAQLLVNGAVSDTITIPFMLDGNPEWDGHPNAPTTMVRRRLDWSWVDVPKHIDGCTLL